jgi:hypothetical protein
VHDVVGKLEHDLGEGLAEGEHRATLFSDRAARATAKIRLKTTICRTSFSASALKRLVGKIVTI